MATNELKVIVNADTKQAQKGLSGLKDRLDGLSKKARTAGIALSAMGGVGLVAIKSFASAAIEQESALRVLGATVENTGVSFESVKQKILDTTAALQDKTNFGDEEQIRVLGLMTTILGDVDQAMLALPAVMDAASASGKDLNSVAQTLTKALAGQVHQAESVGIQFDKNATFAERLEQTLGKVGGAAEANVDPFKQLTDSIGDLKEQMGAALLPALIPILTKMRDMVKAVTEWADAHPTLSKVLGITAVALTGVALVVGPLLLLLPGLALAVKGLIVAFGLLSGPILIVTGIVAAFAYAWKRDLGNIRDITDKALNKIANQVIDFVNVVIKGINIFRKIMGDDLIDELDHVNFKLEELLSSTGRVSSGIHVMTTKTGELAEKTKKLNTALEEQNENLKKGMGAMLEDGQALSLLDKQIMRGKFQMMEIAERNAALQAELDEEELRREEANAEKKLKLEQRLVNQKLGIQMEYLANMAALTDARAATRHNVISGSSTAFTSIPRFTAQAAFTGFADRGLGLSDLHAFASASLGLSNPDNAMSHRQRMAQYERGEDIELNVAERILVQIGAGMQMNGDLNGQPQSTP